MPRLRLPVLFVAASLACAPGTIAITNVTVIPMTGTAATPDQTILIRRGRIASIGPAHETAVPGKAEIIDGRGKYAIPGLWDMHVHAAREGRARYFWPLFLAHGVTGVREMGSYLDTLVLWRRTLERHPAAGPRVIWSSPMLDGSPASWTHAIALTSAAQARATVDSMHARGFDFLKVYERLPRDVYLAVAEQAARRGVPFAGHLPDGVDPVTAAEAGQRSIEHGSGIYVACIPGAAALLDSVRQNRGDTGGAASRVQRLVSLLLGGPDEAACDRVLAALVANGTAVTPTMTVRRSYAIADTSLRHDPRARFAPPPLVARWVADAAAALARKPPEERDFDAAMFRRFVQFVGTMHRAGVTILAGTDASDEPFVYAGASLHDELELLVSAGLGPADALAAATARPAAFLGATDSLGTLEPGKVADLVILDADPLVNIANTRRVHAVVSRGRLIAAAAIASLLDTARAEAARARPAPPARR
jgi:imidazolonepropionase-like amidohydrolase